MHIRCIIVKFLALVLLTGMNVSYWFMALPSTVVESLQYLELSEMETLTVDDELARLAAYHRFFEAVTTNWRKADQLQDSRRRDEFWYLHRRIRSAVRDNFLHNTVTDSDKHNNNAEATLVTDKKEWPWPNAEITDFDTLMEAVQDGSPSLADYAGGFKMPPLMISSDTISGENVAQLSAQDVATLLRVDRVYGLTLAQTRRRANYDFEDEAKLFAASFRVLFELANIAESIPLRVWLAKRRWRFLTEAVTSARLEFDERWYSLAAEGLGNVLASNIRDCWSNRQQHFNDIKATATAWVKRRIDLIWRVVQAVRTLWKGSSTPDMMLPTAKTAVSEKATLVQWRRQLAYRAARLHLNRVLTFARAHWKDAMQDAKAQRQGDVDAAQRQVRDAVEEMLRAEARRRVGRRAFDAMKSPLRQVIAAAKAHWKRAVMESSIQQHRHRPTPVEEEASAVSAQQPLAAGRATEQQNSECFAYYATNKELHPGVDIASLCRNLGPNRAWAGWQQHVTKTEGGEGGGCGRSGGCSCCNMRNSWLDIRCRLEKITENGAQAMQTWANSFHRFFSVLRFRFLHRNRTNDANAPDLNNMDSPSTGKRPNGIRRWFNFKRGIRMSKTSDKQKPTKDTATASSGNNWNKDRKNTSNNNNQTSKRRWSSWFQPQTTDTNSMEFHIHHGAWY